MTPFGIRNYRPADFAAVSRLLDDAIGVGFWDPAELSDEIALVAEADHTVVGVGTAALEPSDAGSVGLIRLIAVDSSWRKRGVGGELLRALVERTQSRGATSHLAYAWVHGPQGTAPLATVLAGQGFVRSRRIEHFYAEFGGALCPACGESPCVCPADVYVRDGSTES